MVKGPFSRRQFIRVIVTGIGVGTLAPLLDACARAVSQATPAATTAPGAQGALPGVDNGKGAPPPPTAAAGQVAITSNADFYDVEFRTSTPNVPGDWKLTLDGNVDKPITLTLDQLKALPVVEEMRTLECISNPAGGPLISNAVWKGVRLKDLLTQAGLKAGTVELKLESFDGYATAIPLALAQDDHSLLVYEMNGQPLPLEHGKPLRCLWPGHYGMKQPKWLTHISAITSHFDGFWEQQGWSNEAPIRPFSRIDQPAEDATVTGATLAVSGVGFSGAAGISKIELSLDNGKTWLPTDLVRGPTPYVWTQWNWRGPVPSDGQVTLLARTTDNTGDVQGKPGLKLLGDTFPNGTDDMQPVIINVKKG